MEDSTNKKFGLNSAKNLFKLIIDYISSRNMFPEPESALAIQIDLLKERCKELEEKISKYPEIPPSDDRVYVLKNGHWYIVAEPGEYITTDSD